MMRKFSLPSGCDKLGKVFIGERRTVKKGIKRYFICMSFNPGFSHLYTVTEGKQKAVCVVGMCLYSYSAATLFFSPLAQKSV